MKRPLTYSAIGIAIGLSVMLPFMLEPSTPEKPVREPQVRAVTKDEVADSLPTLKPQSQLKKEFIAATRQLALTAPTKFASFPDKETYRNEVTANPHGVPAGLKRFAYEMAGEMSRAKKNLADAIVLFDRLQNCAVDANGIDPVKAACAQNAAVLSGLYPDALGTKFTNLLASIDKSTKSALWRDE